MKKLKRYLKPYIAYAIAMVLLLFCQAGVDLSLPNLMSDIVDVGIQHSGITDIAPEVMQADTYAQMLSLASPEDQAVLKAQYHAVDASSMSENDWSAFVERWPAAEKDAVVHLDNPEAAAPSFGRVCYAVAQMASKQAKTPEEAIAAAATMPESVISQTAPMFIQKLYESLGVDLSKTQTHYIVTVGGKMLVMTLLLVCCAISIGFCASRFGTSVAKDLRRDVFTRITSFTNNEYNKFGTASLITRNTNDVMQIQGFLSLGLRTMFYAPIIGIGGIVMALRKSAGMAWIIALAGVVILGILFVLFTVAVPKFKIMQKLIDRLNLVSRESLSGMMVIRAFDTEKFEEARFDRANRALANNNLFVYRAMATMMPTMTLVMNGISLLIVWVGGHRIAAATMQVGDMMAFIQYTMQIIMCFLLISMVFVMVPRAAVSANRIAEVLETPSSVRDSENPSHLSEPVQGVVEFHDVSFHYDGADANVLEHISFTAKPGETTAFIGSTGSGKSTLANLIPRFYDVTSGSITLDGMDIRSIPQQELRSVIGYVPQKGVLFSGDIASNLRVGDEEASEDAMRDAIETAQAAEFVDALPDGVFSPISQGGTNVSGGQRQRLSIARALIKHAPVFIFDDTFSALDFKTDAKLRAALKEKTAHSTVLIVAQRISTIMHADQIVVLDEGHIAGIGTHQELLKSCAVYREIAQSQLTKEELV